MTTRKRGFQRAMRNTKERVTIYQVAKKAQVSLATVSRVINKKGNVTEATRLRVEAAIKELGYKPSGLAQALATNKTTNIALIIPSANYVYIANLLNGITEVTKEKGFTLTVFTTSHSREEALQTLEKVIVTHVDGAIVFDDELSEEDVMNLNSYSVPTIVINKNIQGDRTGSVLLSYGSLLTKIIEEHYQRSDRRMTFLHVHDGGRLLSHCEKVFCEAHRNLGRPYQIVNVDDSYKRTYYDFAQRFREEKEGYYIAYRDSIAAAVENAATDQGLSVPENVEVLSLVGTKYANIVRPTLTSLEIDMAEVGRRAMYMLIDLIDGSLFEKSYRFDARLQLRASTRR